MFTAPITINLPLPTPDLDLLPANRAKANRAWLLQQTDWTQTIDSPLTSQQQAAFATYRQALRDITSQSGFPEEIEWPTAPL